MEERIMEAIKKNLDENGKLSCAKAHEIAHELGAEILLVGKIADKMKVKLHKCQLGCF
ncbi:MAG: hypothetical protein ACI3ZR_09530 [bacterium]